MNRRGFLTALLSLPAAPALALLPAARSVAPAASSALTLTLGDAPVGRWVTAIKIAPSKWVLQGSGLS